MNLSAAVAVGALVSAFAAGWLANGWRLGEDEAENKIKTVEVIRYVEHENQAAADAAGEFVESELAALRAERDRLAGSAVGLQQQAARVASRLSACKAETADEREARERIANVLANVLTAMEQEGRRMALIADERRARGLGAEAAYDGQR